MIFFDANETLDFGKYKGYRVSTVFQYDPEYIQWLIGTGDYCFDIAQLNLLPVSTPFRIKPHMSPLVAGRAPVMMYPEKNPNYVSEAIEFQDVVE